MSKISFWQTAVVVLLGAAIFGGIAYFARIAFRPEGWNSYRGIPWVTYVHPDIKKLKQARALVKAGKLEQARAILIDALTASRQSPVSRQLRDLLGDINTRIFFSNEPSPRKTEYTVKRGDTLSSIARKLKSSAETIMHVNNLDSTLIRIGETLAVPHLDFTVTIDLPRERVIVHDGHGFFTQYPIASADLPPTRKSAIHTSVIARSFYANGRPVRRHHAPISRAIPFIHLRRPGYVLYGVEQDSETSGPEIEVEADDAATPSSEESRQPPLGIAMLKKDLSELDLLIRRGTPVTIIRHYKPSPK